MCVMMSFFRIEIFDINLGGAIALENRAVAVVEATLQDIAFRIAHAVAELKGVATLCTGAVPTVVAAGVHIARRLAEGVANHVALAARGALLAIATVEVTIFYVARVVANTIREPKWWASRGAIRFVASCTLACDR